MGFFGVLLSVQLRIGPVDVCVLSSLGRAAAAASEQGNDEENGSRASHNDQQLIVLNKLSELVHLILVLVGGFSWEHGVIAMIDVNVCFSLAWLILS
jgi:hypothetical protein